MKNTNAGKDTEAKLLPVPLWEPLSLDSAATASWKLQWQSPSLQGHWRPPGTLAIVKMSYQDHPLLSASLTSQLMFPLCAETQTPAASALKQLPIGPQTRHVRQVTNLKPAPSLPSFHLKWLISP